MSNEWTPTLPDGWELVGKVRTIEEVIPYDGDDAAGAYQFSNSRNHFTIRSLIWTKPVPIADLQNLLGTVDESGRFGAGNVVINRISVDPAAALHTEIGTLELVLPDGRRHSFPAMPQHGSRITVQLFAPEHSPNAAPFRGDGKWYPVRDAALPRGRHLRHAGTPEMKSYP